MKRPSKKKDDFKIDLGIDDLSMNFDFFGSKKKQNKQSKKQKPRKQKQKPIMSKKDQESTKKFLKETGSAFGSLVNAIKNRKIRKLEKQAEKQLKESQALAHEVKTLNIIQDTALDIDRYNKEKAKLEKEIREQNAQRKDPQNEQVEHSDSCLEFNEAQINESMKRGICEDRK